MPTVEFTIGNKSYNIACDEGEEARIHDLARSLNIRVESISRTFGSASDSLILAITSLMMEDEMRSLKEKLAIKNSQASNDNQQEIINNELLKVIEPMAEYIETLAKKVQNG